MQGMPGALQVLAALIHTNDTRQLTVHGSLDLTAIQVRKATAAFHKALLPHAPWAGSLPVCLAEYHEGKVRRLRLVLATQSHLLSAEVSSLQDGPYLPGRTAARGLVYGYALDASQTPEWLVIPEGQQSGYWRLLHNSTDPGRRCSVGCSKRYQPKSVAETSRKAQEDYNFEALHRVYFYDAWRPEPILDLPGSELVLPPAAGLLVHGCYWPQPRAAEDVLSVSDAEAEAAENPSHSPASPTTTDATMAAGEASSVVSVPSSPSGPSTLPSSLIQAGTDSPMGEGDADATLSGSERSEGESLSQSPLLESMQWQMKVKKRAAPLRRREWSLPQTTAGILEISTQKTQAVGRASATATTWQHTREYAAAGHAGGLG